MDFVFCTPANTTAVTCDMALQKLADFYDIPDIVDTLNNVASQIRSRRPKWLEFGNKNKLGFLHGILTLLPDQNMRDDYASKLYWTLKTPNLPAPNTPEERSCLNLLYNCFIHPFKQHNLKGISDATPSHESTPSTPGSLSSDLDSNAANPGQSNFKAALIKRDQVCLCCWGNSALNAAHFIAQKSGTPRAEDLLSRAGLDNIFRVQNGVLLCALCHTEFDKLKRYFDVVDGGTALVVKVVNSTNDPANKQYFDAVGTIKAIRSFKLISLDLVAGRTVVDTDNELPVYFVDNDERKYPNRSALAFHKAACLIWKMTGGSDETSDDFAGESDNGSVDNLLAKVCNTLQGLINVGFEEVES